MEEFWTKWQHYHIHTQSFPTPSLSIALGCPIIFNSSHIGFHAGQLLKVFMIWWLFLFGAVVGILESDPGCSPEKRIRKQILHRIRRCLKEEVEAKARDECRIFEGWKQSMPESWENICLLTSLWMLVIEEFYWPYGNLYSERLELNFDIPKDWNLILMDYLLHLRISNFRVGCNQLIGGGAIGDSFVLVDYWS